LPYLADETVVLKQYIYFSVAIRLEQNLSDGVFYSLADRVITHLYRWANHIISQLLYYNRFKE